MPDYGDILVVVSVGDDGFVRFRHRDGVIEKMPIERFTWDVAVGDYFKYGPVQQRLVNSQEGTFFLGEYKRISNTKGAFQVDGSWFVYEVDSNGNPTIIGPFGPTEILYAIALVTGTYKEFKGYMNHFSWDAMSRYTLNRFGGMDDVMKYLEEHRSWENHVPDHVNIQHVEPQKKLEEVAEVPIEKQESVVSETEKPFAAEEFETIDEIVDDDVSEAETGSEELERPKLVDLKGIIS